MSIAVITPRQLTATIVVCASDALETWRASWSASLGRYLICVPPDTLIFTNPEVKPISQISLGEKVLSHSGYREVTRIFRRPYNGNLVEIKTYGGETFKLTPNHPIYSIQDDLAKDGFCKHAQSHKRLRKLALNYTPQWTRADQLKRGDIVLLRFPSEIRDVKEIKVTDYLTHPHIAQDGSVFCVSKLPSGKIARKLKHKIPEIIPISDDFLKLAGLYLAEGFPSKDTLYLSFGKHETYLIDLTKQLFQSIFGIKAHTKEMRTATIVYISSVLVVTLFKNLFGNTAQGKKLPQWALYLPHNKQKILIDAYSKGDGCKDDKRERFVSVSQQLAYQVRQILYRLGRQNSISKKPAGKYEIEGRKGFTKEKFEIATSFKANHSFVDKNFAYLSIREISGIPYQGEVWNLRVAGANSYTITGATLHNCDGTDDNVEIQAAIDALPAGGGKVQLSEGTFTIGVALHPKALTHLTGMGGGQEQEGSTIIKIANGANCNAIENATPAVSITWVLVSDITFDGNRDNNATGSGVVMTGFIRFQLRNFYIKFFSGNGIHGDIATYENKWHTINNGDLWCNDGYGLWISGGGISIDHVVSDGNGKSGAYLQGNNIDCNHLYAGGNGLTGIGAQEASGIWAANLSVSCLVDLYTETNKGSGIWLDSCNELQIIGPHTERNYLTFPPFIYEMVVNEGHDVTIIAPILLGDVAGKALGIFGGTYNTTVIGGHLKMTAGGSYAVHVDGDGHRFVAVHFEAPAGVLTPTSAGTNLHFMKCLGYVTENSGTATITKLAAPAAATAAEGAAGNVDIGAHSWKVTLVDDEGEETEAGTKSNVVTIADSAKIVNLSAVPTGAAGTASRKIYRTVAGDAGDYKLVGTINDNSTTTFADNIADADLGAVVPATNGTGYARTVTHGLAATPTRAQATFTSDPGAANALWASNKGTTTFKVNAKVQVTASTTFDWAARVGEG